MQVQYWPVGQTTEGHLRFRPIDVTGHLVQDWLPAMSANVSGSLFGWPDSLLTSVEVSKSHYMTLHESLRGCERQWKGFLSWMLGVAGARHFLRELGYRWIAPCSAFYPNAVIPVDVKWHPKYPRPRLKLFGRKGAKTRLCPDFIAVKLTKPKTPEFCVAEAKGTSDQLSSQVKCKPIWRLQVQNVRATYDGKPLHIARHLVVASRVNPNAKEAATRRVQLRAWNSNVGVSDESSLAFIPIVTMHLAGLYNNFGFPSIANQLVESLQARDSTEQLFQGDLDFLDVPQEFPLTRVRRTYKVTISQAARNLTTALLTSTSTEAASEAIRAAEVELRRWESRIPGTNQVVLPSGVLITAV